MSSHEEDRPVSIEFLGYRYRDLHRRVGLIEGELEKHDLAVIALKLDQAIDGLASIRKALYALMFTIVAGSVTFAFTIFGLLGKHP